MRKLSQYEQETIINFNKEEKTARIFTYEKTWQQHLEKKLGLKPLYDNGFGGREYEIDKKRIPKPRAPKKLSAETKQKMAKRMADIRYRPVLRSGNPIATVKSANKTPNKG